VSAAVLLLICPDRKGLVAAVSEFVYRHGGNILHADQHADEEAGLFLQRVEFALDDLDLARDEIQPRFDEVAQSFGMRFEIHFRDDVARVAVLLSREAHCMYDLLARWRTGELPAEIPVVVSNHPDHADAAAAFGVEYHHLPVTPETRPEQERALLRLLDEKAIDLVVLARYMQILGPEVVDRYEHRIINIHHSFLPAFAGPRPYHRAYERGVKLIGATAHYATPALDEGPIIGQDVAWVSHRDSVDDLMRKGRDLEKVVLARAVHQHLEHRVLVYQNRTVVFD
jgi:formyltetrahydrofolate deformylase